MNPLDMGSCLDPDGIDLEVMHWPNHTGSAAGATLTSAGWRSRKT